MHFVNTDSGRLLCGTPREWAAFDSDPDAETWLRYYDAKRFVYDNPFPVSLPIFSDLAARIACRWPLMDGDWRWP